MPSFIHLSMTLTLSTSEQWNIYALQIWFSLSPREDVVKESLEESTRSTVTKHITFSPTESY